MVPFAACLVGGCASSGAAGSETHFVCAKDADCRAGSICVAGTCEVAPASGGRAGADASTGSGGTPGNGGAVMDASSGMTPNTGGAPNGGVANGGASSGGSSGGGPIDDRPLAVTCPTANDVAPVDEGCGDQEVCHLVIRLDYRTLGLLGYTVAGGAYDPVDGNAVLQASTDVLSMGVSLFSNPTVVPARSGVFRVYATPSDFGAFALASSLSRTVITAGSIVWAGHGTYVLPAAWRSALDVTCAMKPAGGLGDSYIDANGCDDLNNPGAASPADALDVALRTNLALHFAQRGPYAAFTYLYTPSVGSCDSSVADYLVVLTSVARKDAGAP
jgi:hypothetical protein